MRSSLATTNFYCLQYCLKRPYLSVALVGLILLLIKLHQQYSIQSYANTSHKFRRDDQTIDEFDDLHLRIEDLKRIKQSVINELKSLQREKDKLQQEKSNLSSKNEKLLTLISRSKFQLKQLELDIAANRRQKFEKNCDNNRVAPIIFNPLRSVDICYELNAISNHSSLYRYDFPAESEKTTFPPLSYTFDLSQCPITKEFKFHLIGLKPSSIDPGYGINSGTLRDILLTHRQHTDNSTEACILVHLSEERLSQTSLDASRNNLVIHLSPNDRPFHRNSCAVASSVFQAQPFRDSVDLVLPSVWSEPSSYDAVISSMPPQSPIDRKYLASYFGTRSTSSGEFNQQERILQVIHRNSIDDLFLFMHECGAETGPQCYDQREKMLELSSFVIIIHNTSLAVDVYTNELLHLALSRGTIPVVIGRENLRLPFDEVIDWRRAAILMHSARLPEIHFILRSLGPSDIYQMKYHGRLIFERYLATVKQIADTIISILSINRFDSPPPVVENIRTLFHHDEIHLKIDENCTTTICQDARTNAASNLLLPEMLGPRERPFTSQSFRRNFSLVLNSAHDLWNNPIMSPFELYPSLPQDPISPSEHKFISPETEYRPINDGLGGSGFEFSRSLGGDQPNEQFTIVLLTYERNQILMRTLERLKGLSYLNKILIVWNGINHPPKTDSIWPDVGVPIELIKVQQNSLNNRFLPYDTIKTDAILSLDDDSPLRPDEIVFGFRVWRESRDRIVGFPGRFHAWDNTQAAWLYNSNHSCELSMVLTGGAFFHRYYSYVYTYNMPQAIRSIVDKFMNCEDIAMNFLVAHLTRKPPIKVTSRWTFHCPGCPSSLSEDDSHFRERHECLNTFASIYGYMPLLNTQHRSDSVLFKTRLPHDKQKCFKYV